MTSSLKLWIHGSERSASTGERFSSINPADGSTHCHVELAGPKDVDDAVASASDGARVWAETPLADRSRVLRRAAELLRSKNDELARLEVLDTGKPIAEARTVDVISGADCLDFFASATATLHGEHIDLGQAFAYTRREPLGVCAGIGAWNYPLQIACWKSAPALACGNAMVFKPSELTPTTALELARVYRDAGLPPGVFNVVQGPASTGQALVRHQDVAKVSLTGEVTTGRRVMADAAETLKHVTMELGGKSPLIVFADADLDNAVSGALMANFFTQGEVCTNGTRVFLHASIAEEFTERLVRRAKNLRVGDPLAEDTQVGALISGEHRDRVLRYIEIGKSEGARLRCGGTTPGSANPNGFFVEPTVFDQCTDEMTIVREEIFGPVLSILTFEDEDEVIARANDTRFGLAAGVFTHDLARAHRTVGRLRAGTCWINDYNITPVEMPFGGTKESGIGRENGLAALDFYSERKSVYVSLGKVDCPY